MLFGITNSEDLKVGRDMTGAMSPYVDILDTIAPMEQRPFIHTVDRLAAVVKEARKGLGLTQAQLAEQADVSRHFVIEVEAGHPRAEFGKVLAILEALGLSPRAVPSLPQWAFDETGALKDEYRQEFEANSEAGEDNDPFI